MGFPFLYTSLSLPPLELMAMIRMFGGGGRVIKKMKGGKAVFLSPLQKLEPEETENVNSLYICVRKNLSWNSNRGTPSEEEGGIESEAAKSRSSSCWTFVGSCGEGSFGHRGSLERGGWGRGDLEIKQRFLYAVMFLNSAFIIRESECRLVALNLTSLMRIRAFFFTLGKDYVHFYQTELTLNHS